MQEFRTRRVPPLSTRQLGDRAGMSHGMITAIEQGWTRPGMDRLEALSTALRVPYGELLALYRYPSAEVAATATGDPLERLGAVLAAGAWSEDVSRALYTLAAATRTPAVADLPAELVERVRAAWDYARKTQAAYQERDPAWRERRVAERFTQYLTGEVERAPQLESSADIVDLRP